MGIQVAVVKMHALCQVNISSIVVGTLFNFVLYKIFR